MTTTTIERVTSEQLAGAKKAAWDAMTEANRLDALYEQQTVVPKMRENVGLCFKTEGGNGENRWWIYERIIGMDGANGRYRVLSIYRDNDGDIRIATESYSYRHRDGEKTVLGNYHEQITHDEFRDGTAAIVSEVASA